MPPWHRRPQWMCSARVEPIRTGGSAGERPTVSYIATCRSHSTMDGRCRPRIACGRTLFHAMTGSAGPSAATVWCLGRPGDAERRHRAVATTLRVRSLLFTDHSSRRPSHRSCQDRWSPTNSAGGWFVRSRWPSAAACTRSSLGAQRHRLLFEHAVAPRRAGRAPVEGSGPLHRRRGSPRRPDQRRTSGWPYGIGGPPQRLPVCPTAARGARLAGCGEGVERVGLGAAIVLFPAISGAPRHRLARAACPKIAMHQRQFP